MPYHLEIKGEVKNDIIEAAQVATKFRFHKNIKRFYCRFYIWNSPIALA